MPGVGLITILPGINHKATDSLIAQYEAVYNAMKATGDEPGGLDAEAQNKLVKDLLACGFWDLQDYFSIYGIHTNDNGEALLNWILPAGGSSLMDSGKGTFDSGTESWAAYGNNTIANDNGALKISYVDDDRGAYTRLRLVDDLSTNLVIGKWYRVRFRVKMSGTSVSLEVYDGAGTNVDVQITESDWTWKEIVFKAKSIDGAYFRGDDFNSGEILWIDQWYVQEWQNGIAYNSPAFESYAGFTGDGATTYINTRFNPAVSGVNYQLNSASISVAALTEGDPTDYDLGMSDGTDVAGYLLGYLVKDYLSINSNGAGADIVDAGLRKGIFMASRTASNIQKLYRNKTIRIDGTQVSSAIPDLDFYALARNNNTSSELFTTRQIAMIAIGGGLTQTIIEDATDAINTYMGKYGNNLY